MAVEQVVVVRFEHLRESPELRVDEVGGDLHVDVVQRVFGVGFRWLGVAAFVVQVFFVVAGRLLVVRLACDFSQRDDLLDEDLVFFLEVQRPDSFLRQLVVESLVALFEFVRLDQRVFFSVLRNLQFVLERVDFFEVLAVPLSDGHF